MLIAGSTGEGGQALGFSAADNGDEAGYARAVIDDLNRQGGLGGHPVIPVVFNISQNSSGNADTDLQAACTFFTQDHRVVAALLSWHGHNSSFYSCLEKKGVLIVDTNGIATGDAAALAATPHLVAPNGIALDRVGRSLPEVIGRTWFGGENVGVIAVDAPEYRRAVDTALTPAIARLGAQVRATVFTTPYKSAGDAAQISSQLSSAVLRFREAGVTRVVDLSGAVLVFATLAETQQYRPRYGLTTASSPAALTANGVPARQLEGAAGMGWMPVYDTGNTPPSVSPPGHGPCLDLMKRRGLETNGTTVTYTALTFCEGAGFLRAIGALVPRTEPMTGTALLETLRTERTISSSMTFITQIAHSRRDGAARQRPFRFDEGCACFTYA